MKLFGSKKEFAIGVSFYVEDYKDHDYIKNNLDACWKGAEVYFWVKGKNLFEFIDSESNPTYTYNNLHALVDFFCDFLIFQISEDSFPILTKATNAYEMIEETELIKTDEHWKEEVLNIDWDQIDMELRNKRNMWMSHHGFLQNRGGTFLPHAYMRKVNNTIEISWNNKYPHENEEREFYFLHKQGVEYVDIELYKDSIVQFCLAYIKHVEKNFQKLSSNTKKNYIKPLVLNSKNETIW